MFKNIQNDSHKKDVDVIETITRLVKYLLNLQQMFAQQAVYIVFSLPLNTS
jgi:hypothetical protein